MIRNVSKVLISNPLGLLIILLFVGACSTSKTGKTRTSYKPKTTKLASIRANVCKTAMAVKGTKYKYGGKTPKTGFDCSGLTTYAMKKNGIDINGPSYSQARRGEKRDIEKLEPGDLVFFKKNGKVNHVGLVLENERQKLVVIHSTSSRGVVIDNIWDSSYWSQRIAFGRSVIN